MNATTRSTVTALILLFALVSALLAAIVVPAYLSWAENGRIIRENREKIAMIRTSQNSFIRVKKASDQWALFGTSPEAGFLDAATPEEALEEARLHVAALLDRHGGVLEGGTFASGEPKRNQVETVAVDLTAILPKTGLAPFLTEFEDSPPYAFISAFRVTQRAPDGVRLVLKAQMQHLGEGPQ